MLWRKRFGWANVIFAAYFILRGRDTHLLLILCGYSLWSAWFAVWCKSIFFDLFSRSTIPEEKWGTTNSLHVISLLNAKFFQIWSSVAGYGELWVCFQPVRIGDIFSMNNNLPYGLKWKWKFLGEFKFKKRTVIIPVHPQKNFGAS